METNVFTNLKNIAFRLFENQKLIKIAQKKIAEDRSKLKEVLKKEYSANLDDKEKKFLDVIVCPNDNDYSIKKTVLDIITDNAMGVRFKSELLKAKLVINPMIIRITSDELNRNGFYYDSGRSRTRNMVDSLFGKLGVIVAFKEFDYQDKNILAIGTKQSVINN